VKLHINMHSRLIGALRGEEGQGLVEYGLIISLVALVAIAGLTILGSDISTFFGGLGGMV
jgi:pilus assembly protein Flp/PilA